MSDLLIASVTGAGLTVAIVIALVVLSLKLSSAKDEREAARVQVAKLEGDTKLLTQHNERLTKDLRIEQERSNALDDAYAKLAASSSDDGAYQRLLSRWQVDHAAARGRTVLVPAPTTTTEPGPDDLLSPWDRGGGLPRSPGRDP